MSTGIENKDYEPIKLASSAVADYCCIDDLDFCSGEYRH
jgi:hypothetical protein